MIHDTRSASGKLSAKIARLDSQVELLRNYASKEDDVASRIRARGKLEVVFELLSDASCLARQVKAELHERR